MNDRATILANLTSEDREKLIQQLRTRKTSSGSVVPIRPRPRSEGEGIPLSPAQRRFWFLERLESGNPVYNEVFAARISGDLSIEVFERALSEVIRRHEVLRTSIHEVEGLPVQVVQGAKPFNLPVQDLSALGSASESKAIELAKIETRKSFDLSIAPLMRGVLYKLSDVEALLVITMHHIVADHWSISILASETADFYRRILLREPSVSKPLSIQYADYSQWQLERLSDPVMQKELQYWVKQLGGAPSDLGLPSDRARPAMQSFAGGRVTVLLAEDLKRELRGLAEREHVTLFMVLLSCFVVLLYRYSGNSDVVVASPALGRGHPELEPLIGPFLNTLALRVRVVGNVTFLDLIAHVRNICLEAYGNQDIPFERVVEALNPQRDMSRLPFSQAMFAFQNIPMRHRDIEGVRMEIQDLDIGITKCDLMLYMEEVENGLVQRLLFSTDLFDRSTIERMAAHLSNLLRQVVRDPSCAVGDLSMLDHDEIDYLVREWNATERAIPDAAGIHCLFEEQASLTPGLPAVVTSDGEWSYAGLNTRANLVADWLSRLGIAPGDLIAVSVRRSKELVAVLLGILKSGGAYVPVDRTLPEQRIDDILRVARPRVIVVDDLAESKIKCIVERMPGESYMVNIDRSPFDSPKLIADMGAAQPTRSYPASTAYVIFTSGSTGVPKGVVVPHSPAINVIDWVNRTFNVGSGDRLLFTTSLSFDLSVYDIFGILAVGGSIYIAVEEECEDPHSLVSLLHSQPITLWDSAPAAMQQLIPLLPGHEGIGKNTLRLALFSGDWIPLALPDAVRQHFPNTQVVALGGATEATIWSNWFPFHSLEPSWSSIPYGKPIQNSRYYVLDDRFNPCPINVPGDLYIGGECLSFGYLGDCSLTAQKFIPDRFATNEGARMYRTGDVARHRRDGNLEFLGRRDFQVKLRGFRIELGEIEANLEQDPFVSHAIAAVQTSSTGEKQLVAYIVSKAEQLNLTELRAFLAERLPEYMVPVAIERLDYLPVTPNGKLDRKALPIVEVVDQANRVELLPHTPIEEIVATFYKEVLKLPKVFRKDDFFALGGHSLSASQIMARVRSTFDVDIPLRQIFLEPTVSGVARAIEVALSDGGEPAERPIPGAGGLRAPLSAAQERFWFIQRLDPKSVAYNMSATFRIVGELDVQSLKHAFLALVKRHWVLRSHFRLMGDDLVQEVTEDYEAVFQIEDLRNLSSDIGLGPATKHIVKGAAAPFQLELECPIRARLFRMTKTEQVLAVTLHHIAGDAISVSILVRELSEIYESICCGRNPDPPNLRLQYSDYAVWQRKRLDEVHSQFAYWSKKLENVPVLNLPTDYPRPPKPTNIGGYVPIVLDQVTLAGIAARARQDGLTVFMLFLAAFQILLSRWTGQDDVSVGTAVSGRRRAEFEPLIGCFINTIVLRESIRPWMVVEDFLRHVRDTCISGYVNQEFPFERLVEELAPNRTIDIPPLFQAAISLENSAKEQPTLRNLLVTQMETDTWIARFDLELVLRYNDETVSGGLLFRSDLFTPATASLMLEQWLRLLREIAERPKARIADLRMVSQDEESRLLGASSNSTAPGPDEYVHTWFERQTAQTPTALALATEVRGWSYGELNSASNQLASYLVLSGIRPGSRIGISLPRSAEMMVALLAVLKAGCAYVAIDASQPAWRLKRIADDARLVVVLAMSRQSDLFVDAGIAVLALDELRLQIEAQSTTNLTHTLANPLQEAYVIFTSGSTGTPKGCVLTHRGLVNLARFVIPCLLVGPESRVLQFAPLTFDASVWEWSMALLSGACLVLPDPSVPLIGQNLSDCLFRNKITVVTLPPSVLASMPNTPLPDLSVIVSAGEPCCADLLERWSGTTTFYNAYGPTETTVCATISPPLTATTQPTIGRAIANTQTYVLDRQMHLCPVGIPGELYVGGFGLAEGYVGLPDVTAERFVPNPFSGGGERLYRTGDRVRYQPNGSLEFIGRFDDQIKLRGHRIELGEIESAMLKCQRVSKGVALAIVNEALVGELVVFVIPTLSLLPSEDKVEFSDEVRRELRTLVPSYMMPDRIIPLEDLPQLANGKVDRKTLAESCGQSIRTEHRKEASTIEELIAEMARQILGRESISLTSNFFELGLNSLSIARLITSLEQELGHPVPLMAAFENPTPSLLAEWLAAQDNSKKSQQQEASRAANRKQLRSLRRTRTPRVSSPTSDRPGP